MPLPAIRDIAHDYLFRDRSDMQAAGLSEVTMNHLIRLRDIYNYWLNFPSKRDRDIIRELSTRYGIGETQAREDLRTIKVLLGDLERVSKDYMRYRVTEMANRAYEMAERANNPRDMVAAAKLLKEVHRLDQEDDRASVLDKLVPVVLKFTDDPEVIGLHRIPDHREKIRKLKEQYWLEDTVDVQAEEIDARIDDIFNPSFKYGEEDMQGISE